MGVNTGYRPGWVHFSARCGKDTNLLDFFRAHRPEGADSRSYGQGHDQAGGGALPVPVWNVFARELGFGPDMLVDDERHRAPSPKPAAPAAVQPDLYDLMTADSPPLSRLGFAVLVLGQPGLKSSDTRRWQKNPHLLKSIEYLHGVFATSKSSGSRCTACRRTSRRM